MDGDGKRGEKGALQVLCGMRTGKQAKHSLIGLELVRKATSYVRGLSPHSGASTTFIQGAAGAFGDAPSVERAGTNGCDIYR
jgi:hypothetical protein